MQNFISNAIWRCLGLLALAATVSCSDDSAATSCTPDPALIAQNRACTADEDCPCGAGCELGVCKAGCTGNESCGGGSCDRFGRCRESGDSLPIPPLVAPTLRAIELSPSTLRSTDPSVAQPLHLRVGKGSGELRVAADKGLELRCEEAGAFQAECRVKNVAAGQDVVVWVRPAGSQKLTAALQVRAYFGDQMSASSVSPAEDSSMAATGALRAGKYSGDLTLVAAGVAEDPGASGQAFDDLSLPIDASVHLVGGVLVLEDPLKVLASEGKWIGRLTPKGENLGTVDFPTIAYLAGELTSGAPTEVLLDAPAASYSATASSITFELTTRFEGVLLGLKRPQARWRVSLSRTGDLPAGAVAPAVPADLAPTLAASRGLSPTPWEAAVGKAATPDPSRVLGLGDKERRAFLEVFGRKGASGTLESCNLSASTVGVLAQLAVKDSWGTEPTIGSGWTAPAPLVSSGLPVISKLASALASKTSVSISAQVVAGATPTAMPCKASFPPAIATFKGACGADEEATFEVGSIDLCTQMAASYGCQVVDVTGASVAIGASISTKDAASCTRSNSAITIAGTASRVCRLPVVPAPCAELALCHEKVTTAAGTTPESVVAPYLSGAATLALSGDAKCASGARTAAIEADVNAELPVGDPARPTTVSLTADCESDLAAIRGQAAGSFKPYGDGLEQAFVGSKCLQAARLLYAIGVGTDADRRRAIGADAPIVPLGSALANRLIQRWLIHHAYLAREAAESARMAEVLRDSPETKGLPMPSVEAALASSLAGWQLLLHPRFASGVAELPASVLVDPDYRQLLTSQAVPRLPYHEQPIGLPVAMLDTLFAQLSLVEPGLERAALNRDATGIKTLAQTLRHLLVVRALASELAAGSAAHAVAKNLPEPVWLARYQSLARGTKGLVGRLIGQARAIQRGENPLGITAEDTPLYFFGDEKSATRRFSAISDYLIGDGPGSKAWAPTLVQRATDSLKAARTAWLAKRDRAVQVLQSQAELDSRLDRIRQSYGAELANLCGKPEALSSSQLLEKWTSFSEHTCAFRSESAVCKVDPDAYPKLLTAAQVGYQLCVVKELRKASGKTVQFVDDGLNAIADALDGCPKPSFPSDCKDGSKRCVSCGALSAVVTPASFRQLAGLSSLEDSVVQAAKDLCAAKSPGVDTSLPGPDEIAGSPAGMSACFSGSIGEAVFEIRSTADDLEIARSQLADLKEAYAIAMSGCILQKVSADKQDAASAPFQTALTVLGSLKLAADIAASVAEGAKDCASECFDVETWATGGAKAVTLCVLTGVKTAASVASTSLTFSMEQVKQASDAAVAEITKWASDKKCIDDASQKLVGINTAALRIQRALTDVEKASYRLAERKAMARRVYDDGRAALAAAQGRLVAPLTHDLWLDEGIKVFLRDLRFARRIMYLAVRAVGYETQQSVALENTVLTATNPQQLQNALDELWASAATRGVGGKRPSDLKVVLSLREHLLQLADRRDYNPGEQNLSEVERFRLLLRSPKHAVFENGAYAGQRIPFEIVPLGKLGIGQAMGIPVLTGADCAERLWSVNASILGSADLYRGSSPPTFTRVDLLKQNTFYSQWCSPPASGPSFQVASVRPSQNLFQDPVYGGDLASGLGPKSEAQQFTRARIQAYFNVDRKTFEEDTYANGETSELAARGLYGSYALFIPAETLSLGSSGKGLALNQVDDVLLRLNYVSVAR